MEFRRVEYFLVLAETLHFHKAADILCISPPALSRQIALLEEDLGGKLFERTTKTVNLTPNGEIAYEHFMRIKRDWDSSIRSLKKLFTSPAKELKIGFFSLLPKADIVNKIINHIAFYHKGYKFQIISGEMTELHTMLLNREIDFCITATNDHEDWSGCRIFKCRTFPAKLVVSLLHPWNIRTEISKVDIENGSIVLLSDDRYLKPSSIYKNIITKDRTMVSDFDALIASLEIGENFTISPEEFNGAKEAQLKFFDLPEDMRFNCYWICACRDDNVENVRVMEELRLVF